MEEDRNLANQEYKLLKGILYQKTTKKTKAKLIRNIF